MFLSERIESDGITIATDQIGGMSDDGLRCRWAVTLHRPDGRTFSLPDPFESNDEPTAFDVLDLVTSHCNTVDQVDDWQGFASEYIGDVSPEDADKWRPMWVSWSDINDRLLHFLGHQEHHDYLYETDRSR